MCSGEVTAVLKLRGNAGERRFPTFSKGNGVPPLLGDLEGNSVIIFVKKIVTISQILWLKYTKFDASQTP